MQHLVIPTVNVYVINGSKLLLSRRFNTGWMDGRLCPPGGHIETGESPIMALVREINEELGVSVRAEDLEFSCVAARNTSAGETVAYEFIIRDKEYAFTNAEKERCSELVWVELSDLPDDISDEFKLFIRAAIIEKQPYVEYDNSSDSRNCLRC